MKGNFGSLRERTNYYRNGEIAIIHRLSPKMSIVHPWMICLDLPMPHEVFDLLNKEILGLTRVTCEGKLSRCPSWPGVILVTTMLFRVFSRSLDREKTWYPLNDRLCGKQPRKFSEGSFFQLFPSC